MIKRGEPREVEKKENEEGVLVLGFALFFIFFFLLLFFYFVKVT